MFSYSGCFSSSRGNLLTLMAFALFALPLGAAMAQGSMPAPKVPVITVQPQAVEIYSSYPGRTQAHREVQVRAQVGGILLSREYVEGERVQSGDLLFRIDPRPYEAAVSQARADLQNAQALLNQANRNWQRISSLFERGVASEKDRDDARSAQEIAEAGLEVARAPAGEADRPGLHAGDGADRRYRRLAGGVGR